jgi:hypothetical protein
MKIDVTDVQQMTVDRLYADNKGPKPETFFTQYKFDEDKKAYVQMGRYSFSGHWTKEEILDRLNEED